MNKIFKIILIFFLCIFSSLKTAYAVEDKIKIGLLIPITGDNKNLGELIIKSMGRDAHSNVLNIQTITYPLAEIL